MATKEKILKLMQEQLGYAQITNRRPLPKPSVLFLMQLRTNNKPQTAAPRRKLAIVSYPEALTNTPLPVRINYIQTDSAPSPANAA